MNLSPEDIDREIKGWHRRITERADRGRVLAVDGAALLEAAWRYENLRKMVEQIRSQFSK